MPYAKTNGINLYYEAYGKGFPVVLISGLGSQHQSWATQIPIYSEHFKVIAFDNRGIGKSDKPDYPYTTKMMADDTVGLLDHLKIERAHIVGKSMGGMIAQWIGIDYSERVEKIVMGCTSGSRDEVGNLILRIGRDVTSKVGPKTGWLLALFLGYSRQYIETNYSSIMDSLETIPEDTDGINGYLNQSYACENHEVLEFLHSIKSKTLVMYGEKDLLISPERSKRLAEFIPNSIEKSFPDVGHGFWRECQKEVDKFVLDFLSES